MKWIIEKEVEAATLPEAIKQEAKGTITRIYPSEQEQEPYKPGFKA